MINIYLGSSFPTHLTQLNLGQLKTEPTLILFGIWEGGWVIGINFLKNPIPGKGPLVFGFSQRLVPKQHFPGT